MRRHDRNHLSKRMQLLDPRGQTIVETLTSVECYEESGGTSKEFEEARPEIVARLSTLNVKEPPASWNPAENSRRNP